jgi:Mg2+ and Co2+ transporter CorA
VGNSTPSDVVSHAVATARAQLDDLMAELEAGSRFVDKIDSGVAALDDRLIRNQQQQVELAELVRRLSDLRESVRQQRALMNHLRQSFDLLRRQTAGRR